MSRMRVLQVNLHLTESGVLAAVLEIGWKGHHRTQTLLQRTYIEGPGIDASPGEVLDALARIFDLQPEHQETTLDP